MGRMFYIISQVLGFQAVLFTFSWIYLAEMVYLGKKPTLTELYITGLTKLTIFALQGPICFSAMLLFLIIYHIFVLEGKKKDWL